jgi:hypothetical protein
MLAQSHPAFVSHPEHARMWAGTVAAVEGANDTPRRKDSRRSIRHPTERVRGSARREHFTSSSGERDMTGSTLFRVLTPLLVMIAAACGSDATGTQQERFTASLTGASEVPAVSTTATGATTFTINGGEVGFSISVQNITAVTAAHIHVGPAGQNGPVAVTLFAPSGPTGTVNGSLTQGTFTAANVSANAGVSFDALLQLMRTGGAYVNVHTTANPPGEIRGQIQRQ